MDRSIDFIISIFGILKSGAAYMPIHPKFPQKRIEYMLNEAQTDIILTNNNINVPVKYRKNIKLIKESNKYFQEELCTISSPSNLAYILYTSGSTGEPKGVMVEHKNVVFYIDSFNSEFRLTNNDRMLQQSVCTFDIFVEEVFPILMSGGTLVIADDKVRENEALLMDFLEKEKITIISVFPQLVSKLNRMTFKAHDLNTIISGGDVLRKEFVTNFIGKVYIYNTYGPSETTVCATYHKYDFNKKNNGRIPIGNEIKNSEVYILNQKGQEVSVGEIGEICITGKGVSRGYLNKPVVTNKVFIYNKNYKKYMYKTGDLGIYNSYGEIEFIKRKDKQIMIDGKRVEIGEVESCLYKLEYITNAIVIAYEDSENNYYLCAYLESKDKLNVQQIKEYLERYLPEFMIPDFFIKINEIPHNDNGKVDAKKLTIPLKG